jgi:hypothetical protein
MNLNLQAKSFFHSLIGKANFSSESVPSNRNTVLNGLFEFSLLPYTEDLLLKSMRLNNVSEDSAYQYQRKLYPLEKGIFDTMDVRLVTAELQQITLSSSQNPARVVASLEKLVKELHQRYGKDDSGYTGFTQKDRECLMKGGYWSGRLWHRFQKKNSVPLNLYADEKGPMLTMLVPVA